jgi:hypothetical protein
MRPGEKDWSKLAPEARGLVKKLGLGGAAKKLGVSKSALRSGLARNPSTMPVQPDSGLAGAFSRAGGGGSRGVGGGGACRGSINAPDDLLIVKAENEELLRELTRLKKRALTTERVRREILRLAAVPPRIPDWTVKIPRDHGLPGVPTLFTSDQHYAEVVDPAQIGGVNEYNIDIAKRRWRRMVEKTIELCKGHMVRPEYPGIVIAAGGDGLSGDIHDELSITNEKPVMPATLELADLYAWTIREFKRHFGRVFFAGVIGNHARNTHKPRYKDTCFTNFDWLAYQIAMRQFQDPETGRCDPDVHFLVPSGPDARYQIYNHRYLLTHSNQFSGGDGIIGALGPVIRGDAKKRALSSQIRQDYDTLLAAHWHQYHHGRRVIINGSMKGFDDFASGNSFPFEPPQQALWMTHPKYGITFSFPVILEEPRVTSADEWVRWAA